MTKGDLKLAVLGGNALKEVLNLADFPAFSYACRMLVLGLQAKILYLITNIEGIYRQWNSAFQELLNSLTPSEFKALDLPADSMGTTSDAACVFVANTEGTSFFGSFKNMQDILFTQSGTWIKNSEPGLKTARSQMSHEQ